MKPSPATNWRELADMLEKDGYIDMHSGEGDFNTIVAALRSAPSEIAPRESSVDKELVQQAIQHLADNDMPLMSMAVYELSARSATPCREDGNHRFEVSLNGKLYLRTHTIGEADILCRAILDGEMGLPSIYDHMRKTEVMLEQ